MSSPNISILIKTNQFDSKFDNLISEKGRQKNKFKPTTKKKRKFNKCGVKFYDISELKRVLKNNTKSVNNVIQYRRFARYVHLFSI